MVLPYHLVKSRRLDLILKMVTIFYVNLNVHFNYFRVTYQFIIRHVAYESDFGPITENILNFVYKTKVRLG